MGVDISKTVAPKVDQLTADDLLDGTLIGKVTRVFSTGNKDQPIGIDVDSWPLPWKPCKGMRVVLCGVWGDNTSDEYVGRSLRLFRNPDVKYSGIAVGGIEVAAVTNITKPMTIAIRVSRGVKRNVVIQPLRDVELSPKAEKKPVPPPPANHDGELATLCLQLQQVTDEAGLAVCRIEATRLWKLIDDAARKLITTRSDDAKSRLAAPPAASTAPTEAQGKLADKVSIQINATSAAGMLKSIAVDVVDYLAAGSLTAHQAELLTELIESKLPKGAS